MAEINSAERNAVWDAAGILVLGSWGSTCGRWQLQSEPWSNHWSIWRCSPSAPYYCPKNDCGQDNPLSSLESFAIPWRQSLPTGRQHRCSYSASLRLELYHMVTKYDKISDMVVNITTNCAGLNDSVCSRQYRKVVLFDRHVSQAWKCSFLFKETPSWIEHLFSFIQFLKSSSRL